MEGCIQGVYQFIDENQDQMMALWKKFVNSESYTKDGDYVNCLAAMIKEEFEKEGFSCHLVDVGANGNTLVGVLGEERAGRPIIFSGHMDTVFKTGTFGENPFRIEDGKAYGPGVLDMKGGIVIALYVVKALNHIGWKDRPIKVIFSGDEEIGHEKSTGANVFLEESKGGLCAFNMETGLVDDCLCVGRKGSVNYIIRTKGVESHAGNDFIKGKNAIEEMADKILRIQKLTDLEKGTTYSVDIIRGGRIVNAIPEDCEIEVDVRFESVEELTNIEENIHHVCATAYIEGVQTQIEKRPGIMPFETKESGMKFYEFAKEIAAKNGFGALGAKRLGGGSDASYTTMAGVPSICSFGVQGQWNHTAKEYAIIESLFQRTKLIGTIVLNLNDFNIE